MSDHLAKVRAYHVAIRRILLDEWDPIGVADVPEAQDEYDSYVGEIYRLLVCREPRYKLFDYLWQAETEHMLLAANRGKTNRVADLLIELRSTI